MCKAIHGFWVLSLTQFANSFSQNIIVHGIKGLRKVYQQRKTPLLIIYGYCYIIYNLQSCIGSTLFYAKSRLGNQYSRISSQVFFYLFTDKEFKYLCQNRHQKQAYNCLEQLDLLLSRGSNKHSFPDSGTNIGQQTKIKNVTQQPAVEKGLKLKA